MMLLMNEQNFQFVDLLWSRLTVNNEPELVKQDRDRSGHIMLWFNKTIEKNACVKRNRNLWNVIDSLSSNTPAHECWVN